MEKAPKLSPFRLSSLLRLEKNPSLALHLFRSPTTTTTPTTSPPKPFRYSALSYDLIICKLGRARMFDPMEEILDQMKRETRFFPKEVLFCHVISFYGRARLPYPALRTFDRIPSFRCQRTVRSFNSLLNAMLNCRDFEKIRALCRDLAMQAFLPDACTYNVLIRACCFSNSLGDAWDLFDEMRRRRIKPTVVTFGTLISALCANSRLDEAFRLKEEMLNSYQVKPNVFIYTSLIKSLCKSNELDLALKLKEEMLLDKELVLDSAVYSTLIRGLFGAGRKGEVVAFLEEMKGSGIEPDTVTYNAMIAGFCDEKGFDAAFEVLKEMERKECKADVVSYNTIIAGLCKEGRWKDARDLFEDMPRRGFCPDVVSYRTLFGGLCDAGEFNEAVLVLEEMVFKGHAPGVVSLRKFLEGGVCSREADERLVGSALCSLSKGNALVLDLWEMAVGGLLKESDLLKAWELVDFLRMA